MRSKLVTRLAILFLFCLSIPGFADAQNFSFNCAKDTSIPGCTANPCVTLRIIVPDVRESSTTYSLNKVNPGTSACMPVYSNPAILGTLTNLIDDDTYSGVINIGFPFTFYGNTYTSLVVSTNGTVSFDVTRANQFAHYGIINSNGTLDASLTGIPENLPSTLYDRALIMGAYIDLDITNVTSPSRRIQYTTVGTAPNRKWVLTFFRMPFYSPPCATLVQNTSQIILNEGTGIVEVAVFSKQICSDWNQGRSIIGIQNLARDVALMAPGRRASDPPWGTVNMNELWRFVPSAGAPLFVRAELYDIGGTLLPNIPVVNTTVNGTREIYFPNICSTPSTTTAYIIKSVYRKFDDPTVETAGYDTIRVTRGPATDLNATATTVAGNCATGTKGSITAQVPAGTGSGTFEYSLTSAAGPWQASPSFNGLNGGNYTVYVRDAGGGCSSTIPVTLSTTGTMPLTFNTTPTTCQGAINGTITVAGGTPTMEIRINAGPWQPGSTLTGIPAGTHFIDVRDLNTGCQALNQAVTVASGTSTVTGTATGSPTSCAGQSNGSVTVTPQGTGPFEYSLNGGTSWQNNNVFPGLAPGNYTATIRVAGVCTSPGLQATVVSGSGLVPILSSTGTTCPGVNNGTVTVTLPSGTTAPYTIILDGTTTITSNTTTVFSGISAGTRFVRVTDATGCTTATQLTISVPTGTGFIATSSVTGTSCTGVGDGTISISPQSPGTAPFTFVLSPGNVTQNGATTTFTALTAASYSVLVTDANGCTYTVNNISIPQGAGLNASLTPSNASCTGVNNGTVTVITNGVQPYTFVLDGTVTQAAVITNTYTFLNVAAGTHSVSVTDANGCTTPAAVSTTVGTGTGFTATAATGTVSCFGGNDGTITATIGTGGTAPYTFVLNGATSLVNASTVTFTGLPAGTSNTIVVTDAVGCTFTINNISVTQPTTLSATANKISPLCNAGTGSVTIDATGGNAPYSYSLNNITYQAGNAFTMGAGTYTIFVRDAKNCLIQVNNITLTDPPVLGGTAIATGNASCDGGDDGTILVTATGGTATYQYSSDATTFQASPTLRVGPGTYTVTIKDANGCTFTIPGIVVGLTNNLTLTPMADPPPVCEGTGITLQPVTNATSFAWTPVTGIDNPGIKNPVVTPSAPILYTLSATLGRCNTTDDVFIGILPAPTANAGTGGTICFGQNLQLHGTGGTSFNWTPTTFLDNPVSPDPISVNPSKDITYSLMVTDANNCTSLTPSTVTVIVTPPIKIAVTPKDTVVYAGTQFYIEASSIATSYTWSPTNGLSNPNIHNPLVTAPAVGTEMNLQVIGRTDAGCEGEAYVNIRVYTGPEIYLPNAFSPNNDGKNEIFAPFPVGIKKLKYFKVFSRWGQLLFSTTTLHQGWDGKFGGIIQGTGVYIWMVQGITENDKIISKQGTVTLIR